jgi:hypothetical protein
MCPPGSKGVRDATVYMRDVEKHAAKDRMWQDLLEKRLPADISDPDFRARHAALFYGPLFEPYNLDNNHEHAVIELVEERLALVGFLCEDFVYYSRLKGSDEAILLRVNRDVFEAVQHPWIVAVVPASAEEGAAFAAPQSLARCGGPLDRMCFVDARADQVGEYRLSSLMMAAIRGGDDDDVMSVGTAAAAAGDQQQDASSRRDQSVYARMHVPSCTQGRLISKFL